MSYEVFARFDEMFDAAELAKDIAAVSVDNKVEKKDVPFGDYEVKITKLELGECTFDGDYKGMPEAHVWFKILGEGEYAGQMLFMNKKLVSLKSTKGTAFMIRKFNEFLDSLETGIPVAFENFGQYGALIADVFAEIDGKAEYQLSYFDNKGFKDYQIVQRF